MPHAPRFWPVHQHRLLLLGALCVLLLSWTPSLAATYYVTASGGGGSCSTNRNAPQNGLQNGINCASAGDTVIALAGNYSSAVHTANSGTASSPIIIKSDVPYGAVINPSACGTRPLNYGSVSYVIFDGFVVDGINMGSCSQILVHFENSSHSTFQNGELKNTWDNGTFSNSWAFSGGAGGNTLIRGNKIHDIGYNALNATVGSSGSYGIYASGPDMIVEYNEIWNCSRFGIHNYNGPGDRSIWRYNYLHDTAGGTLIAAPGNNQQFYNNILYNTGRLWHDEGLSVNGFSGANSDNVQVHHNTIYSNDGHAVILGGGSGSVTSTQVYDNIFRSNGSDSILERASSGTNAHHNFTADPQFVNAPNNLHLQAGSSALTASSTGGEVGAYGGGGTVCIGPACVTGGGDTTPPTITITNPTSNTTFTTTTTPLTTLAGTASDNVGVTNVTWTNDRGGSGTATGTTSWSVASIALQTGANVLTVTAHDAAGNLTSDTLTVTLSGADTTPPAATITNPTTSPTYTTATSPLTTLAGTATDNVGVTSVTWTNDRGGSGTATCGSCGATGTSVSWSVASVTLQTGANVLTVTAHDGAGNTGSDTLTVTFTPAGGPPYGVTHQEPPTQLAYPNSMWNKPLPADIMSHLDPNSAAMSTRIIDDDGAISPSAWGDTQVWTPGGWDLGPAYYYGNASDPIYTVTACNNTTSATNIVGLQIHIPNGACFAGGYSDNAMSVWDQVTNKVMQIYAGYGSFVCLSTTNHTISNDVCLYGGTADYTNGPDRDWTVSSLGNGAWSVVVRTEELRQGVINHALAVVISCTNGVRFPAPFGTSSCGGGWHPPQGALYFLDYTDAQITAMGLTAWQTNLLRAASRYGMYVAETSGDSGFRIETESTQAWGTNWPSNPVFAWLDAQGATYRPGTPPVSEREYHLPFLANIPNVGGTDVRQHIHVADVCIPLGMAGLSGGCYNTTSDTTPPTVTITTPTSNTTFTTSTTPLPTLAGTASDNVGVTSVTWANDRGGSGTAPGTTSWSVSNLALQAGANVLTVTARDAAGNATTDTLTVTLTVNTDPVLAHFVDAAAGSDTNTGTSGAPWKTIGKCAAVAVSGDVCIIRTGTYRETVTPATNGVTFMPDTGATVTVSGADVVTGWSVFSGNIYKAAAVSWTLGTGNNQIFADGVMLPEARWPNLNGNDIVHPNWATMSGGCCEVGTDRTGYLLDNTLTSFANNYWVGGIMVTQSPGYTLLADRANVTASSGNRIDFSVPNPTGIDWRGTGPNAPYMLIGKLAALDQATESFMDSSGVYVWLQGNANPTSHVIEVKHRLYAFDLSNRSNTTIRGLTIFGAGIQMNSSSANNVLEGLTVKYPTHFVGGNWDPVLDFSPSLDTGIRLWGNGNTLKNCEVSLSAGTGVSVTGTNHTVTNCSFHDLDYSASGAAAIHAYNNNDRTDTPTDTSWGNHTLTYNTIYNTGGMAITHNFMKNMHIRNNLMHDFGLQGTDALGSGTYTWGDQTGGTDISYNILHDDHDRIGAGNGIYLDEGSANFLFHHNVTYNLSSLGIYNKGNNEHVYNNTVWNTAGIGGDGGSGGQTYNNLTNSSLSNAGTDQQNNLVTSNANNFVNAGAGDFHLASGSAAINAGRTITGVTTGFVGSAPDIGAYEFGATSWTAGSSILKAAITSPTTAVIYATSSTTIALSGTANDTIGVTAVTWANTRGGSGTATCSSCSATAPNVTWSIASVSLQTGDNTITVTAQNVQGSTATTTLVVAMGSGTTPPTATLTATPSSLTSGQSSRLDWSSTNATSCTSADFTTGNAISGSLSVSPTATTTYTVTCSNASSQSASAQAIVTVTQVTGARYVATTGTNTGTCTNSAAPCQTIQYCATQAVAGDTCFIHTGTYRETVTPPTNGVTFAPDGSGTVTVSGADIVTGWTVSSGSIYKAPAVSWTMGTARNAIYSDGLLIPEARWPNLNGTDITKPNWAVADGGTGGSSSATLTDSDLTQFATNYWVGGVVVSQGIDYTKLPDRSVVSQSGGNQITFGIGSPPENNWPGTGNGSWYYLMGKLAALDQAGESFMDSTGVYVWLPGNANPSTHVIEVKHRLYAFDLSNRSNITLRGLSIFSAGIQMNASSANNMIDGLQAKYTTQYVGGGYDPVTDHPFDTGIRLAGNTSTIKNCDIGPTAGPGVVVLGIGHTVTNCTIHDTGYSGSGGAGIHAYNRNNGNDTFLTTNGGNHVFTSNTISNVGTTCLNYMWNKNVTIKNNLCYDFGYQGTDALGSAFYSWDHDAGGTEIAYNIIHDSHDRQGAGNGIYFDNVMSNLLVHHNLIYNTNSIGIYTNDNGDANIQLYNNTTYNAGGICCNGNTNIKVYNNLSNQAITTGTDKQNNNANATSSFFVNASTGNFQLVSSAPAVNAGRVITGITDGFAGTAPDIGAYEFGVTAWTAGAQSVTASLSANPTSIASGGSSTLTWSSSNATHCTGDSNFSTGASTPPSGSTPVSPTSNTTYTLTCTSASGATATATAAVTVTGITPPPTASITATPSSIPVGQSTALDWSSMNATSCTGSNFSTGGTTSGHVSVSPSFSIRYSVTCTGSGGSVVAFVDVTVTGSGVPTATLTASATTVPPGTVVTLTWGSTNATACTGTGFVTAGNISGSTPVTVNATTTYTVTCRAPGQPDAVAPVTVTVTGTTPTATLTASSTTVTAGSTVTLTWGSTNATACTGDTNFTTGNATSGSTPVTVTATTAYTVTCTAPGQPNATASVTVSVAGGNPTATLTASALSVPSGSNVTLTWGSTNATSCTGDVFSTGSSSAPNGATTIPVTATLTYTVTCSATGKPNAQASVTVSIVSGNPSATISASATNVTSGAAVMLAWGSTNATTCTGTNFTPSGLSGTVSVTVTATTTYTVRCSATGLPDAAASVTVTLGVSTGGTVSVTLTATPVAVAPGGTVTLQWSATNASTCTGTNFSTGGATSGSVPVNPNTSTDYSVQCLGGGGNAIAFASGTVTSGTIRYVSPSGTDTGSCTSNSAPCRTLSYSIGRMNGGDVLLMANGTYGEFINDTLPSGSSNSPTTLKAQNARQAIIRPSSGTQPALWIGGGSSRSFITIDGVTMDGTNTAPPIYGILVQGGSTADIKFLNGEVRNFPNYNACSTGNNTVGIGVSSNTRLTVRNMHIHDIGTGAVNDPGNCGGGNHYYYSYCMYWPANNGFIEYSEFDHCSAYGLHGYPNGAGNIIRNNYYHDNGGPLFVCESGNTQIYNNLLINNPGTYAGGAGGLLTGGYCSGSNFNNAQVYNNTIVGNNGDCIGIGVSGAGSPANNGFYRNNICYQNGSDAINVYNGSGNAITPNLLGTNPQFVAGTSPAAGGYYRLQNNSPARNAGTNAGSIATVVTTDFTGVTARPQEGTYDYGAYEYIVIGTTQGSPTASLTVSATSVVSGTVVLLTWGSTNATSCTGSNFPTGSGSPIGGQLLVTVTATTTYSVTCHATGQPDATDSKTVTVTTGNPTATITASSTNVSSGSSVTLGWSSTNATSCTGTNFTTGGATSGQVPVTVTATTPYTVTCSATGKPDAAAAVTVTVSGTTPPGITLTVTPSQITPTQTAALHWEATDATSCTGSNFSTANAISGTITVQPPSSTTYGVTCTGPGGSASKTVTLTVQTGGGGTLHYVAPTGTDTGTCTTVSTPCKTIAYGLSQLSGGDTLALRAGTYNERIDGQTQTIPGGTSWTQPTLITAYQSESVTLRPTTGTTPIVRFTQSTQQFIEVNGLILDGQSTIQNPVVIQGPAASIRLRNATITGGATGFATVYVFNSANAEIRTCTISNVPDVAIYIDGSSTNALVDHNTVTSWGGDAGIATELSGGGHTITGNYVHDPATGVVTAGIEIRSTGAACLVTNNVVTSGYGGMSITGGTGTQFFNNTIATMSSYGVRVLSGVSTAQIRNMIVAFTPGITDQGSGSTFTTTLCTASGTGCSIVGNPQFASGGYTLQAGSPALNAGATLASVPVDILGISRPQGTAYDLGAYELTAAPPGGGDIRPPPTWETGMFYGR